MLSNHTLITLFLYASAIDDIMDSRDIGKNKIREPVGSNFRFHVTKPVRRMKIPAKKDTTQADPSAMPEFELYVELAAGCFDS
ncbi:hypothetical protein BJV74DRAFT_815701 [Russula compacta]|nr:hypothetical protein BJV74DRAFT_815701 [Russula compacta]